MSPARPVFADLQRGQSFFSLETAESNLFVDFCLQRYSPVLCCSQFWPFLLTRLTRFVGPLGGK